MSKNVEGFKKLVAEKLENIWFEDNCPELRAAIVKVVKDILPKYTEVICDQSNNPPEVVERNELVCNVQVPVMLTFTLKKRSVTVEEIE